MIDFSKTKYTIFRHEKDKVIALLKKHEEYKACRGFGEYHYIYTNYDSYKPLWERIEEAFDLYKYSLCVYLSNPYVTEEVITQNPDMVKVAVVYIGGLRSSGKTYSLLKELNELHTPLIKVE